MNQKKHLIQRSLRMRRMALASIFEAKSGHPGGVLSAIDIINYILCENKKVTKRKNLFYQKVMLVQHSTQQQLRMDGYKQRSFPN